ncbi:unnamed protein product [Mytilus coruscus]|uniref:HTH psq-type domain-containing protein n=1 Tax=Mytilus coruscus TaxID=42192 RepID=A0A6J8A6H5_MYTCO|nr:unnamed protein product [Mytilus coruscus]
MPKKRKQSVYRTYTDENFIKAIDGIKSGRVSQRKAASLYSISQATLKRPHEWVDFLKITHLSDVKPVIPIEIEKQIKQMSPGLPKMGLGMNKALVNKNLARSVQGALSHLKELNLDQNFKNNTPGKDWWYAFDTNRAENPTVTWVIRSPEKLTSIRARAQFRKSRGVFSGFKERDE